MFTLQTSSTVNVIVQPMQQQGDKRSNFDLTEKQARDIRARALRFVLDCYEQKKAVSGRGGEDDASDEFTHEERRRA